MRQFIVANRFRDGQEQKKRTKDELFEGREDVHAEGDLDLVLLQVQPLAEGLEGRHFVVFSYVLRRTLRYFSEV